ncbi:putative glycosyltransferase EpsH [termite gut metagenome]|uniref:Putative glycosyltransferase EpsH n=1 Tax=termite gut metagenome TaxID=433724 RepID=A0A5J4RNQ7_9ZZZZ
MAILLQITEEYPTRKSQIRIIHHEKNRGLAAARNTGLEAATSEYIIHCDSDDWVEKDMCEKMLNEALEHHSDVVVTDYILEYSHKRIYKKQTIPSNNIECINWLLNEKLRGSNWNKLVKRNLLVENSIKYIEGIDMWEDLIISIKIFFFAKKTSYLNEAFYHYIQYNYASYTKLLTRKSLENLISGVEEIEHFFLHKNILDFYVKNLNYLKLAVKLHLLLNSRGKQQLEWNNLYTSANNYIFLYQALSNYLKIALWFASKKK